MEYLSLGLNGITPKWSENLISYLSTQSISIRVINSNNCQIILLIDYNFAINLVSIENDFLPAQLQALQKDFKNGHIQLIHLWEDVWLNRSLQVKARLNSLIGLNKRIHGRKTKIQNVAKPLAEEFLNNYHLQGWVSSRYKFGLFLADELIALATFSNLRMMDFNANYKSAELIRFAVKDGYSVAGGLTKLIKHFIQLKQPNDIMSYADTDWSDGNAYLKNGFEYNGAMEPRFYKLTDKFERIIIPLADKQSSQLFNTGSLKFILKNE